MHTFYHNLYGSFGAPYSCSKSTKAQWNTVYDSLPGMSIQRSIFVRNGKIGCSQEARMEWDGMGPHSDSLLLLEWLYLYQIK